MGTPCDSILKWGIWEFTTIEKSDRFASEFYRFFQQNKRFDMNSTEDVATGMTIPIEGVPFNFDGSWGRSKKEYCSEAFADELYSKINSASDFKTTIKKASDTIAEKWIRCQELQNNVGGVIASTQYNDDDAIVDLTFKRRIGDPDHRKVVLNGKKLKDRLLKDGLILFNEFDTHTFVEGIPFPIRIQIP